MRTRIDLKRLPAYLVAGFLLILAVRSGLAQGDECPALVQQALDQLGQNCNALDRNSACYGYNRVDATFVETVEDTFFSQPADRSALTQLQTIETAPLDLSEEFWGIAVLNVQANIPNTLPGQAVTFILLGDVAVDNAVAPEDALQTAAPVSVTTLVGSNIRSGASRNANVIGSVPTGTVLDADALSIDGQWLRIVFESGPGWISREVIQAAGDLNTLPNIDREARTPMQAFYFRTGIGDPNCTTAPSLLVVQGPQGVKVDLSANGADVTIGSTIVLRSLGDGVVQLMVVDGEAQLGNVVVPQGFSVKARLSEDGKTIIGDWTDFSPLSAEELELLATLEDLPPNLLHYPIQLPTLEEIQQALLFFSQTSGVGGASTGPAAGQANCSNFKPTSPLGGLPFGQTTFYWDGAPGATSYIVNLYDETGALKASFETTAPNTNLVGDTSSLGGGFSFSWEVVALVNGQVACTSANVSMLREAVPPPDSPVSTPKPSAAVCGNEVCEAGEDYYSCYADCWYLG